MDQQPTNKVKMISDGGTGLYLKIEPTGHKSYVWRWRVAGKHRKVTIGVAHSMDCNDARTIALNYTNAAKLGRDPQLEALAERNRPRHTVNEAWALYVAKVASKQKSYRDKLRIYEADAQPYLGSSRIDAITAADLKGVVTRAESRAYGAGRLIYALLNAFLNWCTEEEIIGSNLMKKKRWKAPAPRTRYLDEDEIGWFLKTAANLRATEDNNPVARWAACFEVLLRTGARLSDIALLTTDEVDFAKARMTLKAARHKSGMPYVLPLTGEVIDILKSMNANPGGRFFNLTSKTRNVTALIKAVNATAGRELPAWSAHCLRRTVDTALRDAWDEERDVRVTDHFIIEAILGHALPGVSKHYNMSTMERSKRKVLDWWSRHINALRSSPDLH